MKKFLPILLLAVLSCELEEAPEFGRVGNEVRFSGWTWDVKAGPAQQGPGPNFFSERTEDIFLDGNGYLHMRIAEHEGTWFSTELVSRDTVGFGRYRWVVEGDFENIPNNTVLGLFTWNTQSFFEEANSEVDIEFAKWFDPANKSLHMSVQPVNFGPYYPERSFAAPTQDGDLIGVSTHEFVWTDSLITWTSWAGEGTSGRVIAQWQFDSISNPARVKNEGGQASRPVRIPKPLNNTNVRMNYWMLGGIPPSDGREHEVIIRSFYYEAF